MDIDKDHQNESTDDTYTVRHDDREHHINGTNLTFLGEFLLEPDVSREGFGDGVSIFLPIF